MLGLTNRQVSSLRKLQEKVESPVAQYNGVRVSNAQFEAMKIAYMNFVKSGNPIPAELALAAKRLGVI